MLLNDIGGTSRIPLLILMCGQAHKLEITFSTRAYHKIYLHEINCELHLETRKAYGLDMYSKIIPLGVETREDNLLMCNWYNRSITSLKLIVIAVRSLDRRSIFFVFHCC